MIVWGKNDEIFPEAGAHTCMRALPKVEMRILDTGHFAPEDKFSVIAPMIHDFLDREVGDDGALSRRRRAGGSPRLFQF